jgi:hypothetical protein
MAGSLSSIARGAGRVGDLWRRGRGGVAEIRRLSLDRLQRAAAETGRPVWLTLAAALGLALMAMAFCGLAAQRLAAAIDQRDRVAAAAVHVPQQLVAEADAARVKEIAGRVRRSTDNVAVEPAGSTIVLRVSSGDNLDAWIVAIAQLVAVSADIRWSIQELCAGRGCSTPIMVRLKAETVSIQPPAAAGVTLEE